MATNLPNPAPLLATYDLTPPVEAFALPQVGTNNRVAGVHTGAGDFVWKLYQSFGDPEPLRDEHRLLSWLAGQGLSFAVPAPIAGRGGETLHRTETSWQALFPLLPGSRPDRRDTAQLAAVGAALGELHQALARYPAQWRPNQPAYGNLDTLHAAAPAPEALMPSHLGLPDEPASNRVLAWWRAHLRQLREFIGGTYQALPTQMIHGDFSIGNTFCHQGRLTAIFDFEFAVADVRALDVAAGLEFAIRYWEGDTAETWWAIATAFCQGYGRRIVLTEAEVAAIPWLMLLRDTVSVIWHTGQGLGHGTGSRGLTSLEHLRETARWLEAHERDLVETIGRAFADRAA